MPSSSIHSTSPSATEEDIALDLEQAKAHGIRGRLARRPRASLATRRRQRVGELASDCPGLVLVEAKANAGGVKTPPSPTAGSVANDARTRSALAEASAALTRYAPSAALSADHGYQLSNRVAFAWKLASMGIPTLLLYLGFTGDDDISDVGEPLRDDDHWKALVGAYADSLGIGALFERRLAFAAPMWTLVRSLPATR